MRDKPYSKYLLPMKRLHLIISDLHLSTGHFLADGNSNPHENFFEDDALVEFLEHYSSDAYRETFVELIINGDLFDLVDIILPGVNPLKTNVEYEKRKLEMIIDGHRELFDALRRFCIPGNRKIRIVIGNHDQSLIFDELQSRLNNVMQTKIDFHVFDYTIHNALIQHGNQIEGIFGAFPEPPTLLNDNGEYILNYTEGTKFHIRSVLKAKSYFPHFHRIRTYKHYFCLLIIFSPLLFIRFLLHIFSIEIIALLKPSGNGPSISSFLRLFNWIMNSDIEQIISNDAYLQSKARYHILGHSHIHKAIQLSKDCYYINTGTWTPVLHLGFEHFGYHTNRPYCLMESNDEAITRIELNNWNGSSHRIKRINYIKLFS